MNTYGTGQYRQTQVTTVDKGRLIVLLYEGAIKFLRDAIEAQNAGDIPAKSNYINRTLDIISELTQSLNMQEGGDIAQNLKRIYQFWTDHLLKAKVVRDSAAMEDVIEMMSSLIEAWQTVCNDAEAARVTAGQENTTAAMTAGRTI
ncbi:flagellar export chaperone FliS [Deltaproteobacteria bacterium OttesenSCG-928-K17]|nr:flagellar export chaperone FliS [Deltaproteobacteria bacterium OttesenSCG-928-K17]